MNKVIEKEWEKSYTNEIPLNTELKINCFFIRKEINNYQNIQNNQQFLNLLIEINKKFKKEIGKKDYLSTKF